MKKEIIHAPEAPAAVGPYVHAIKVGATVYTSGQLGLIPETGQLAEGVAAQAEQSIKNTEAVLREAGCTLRDVVKTTVFLADLRDFAVVNEVYAKYFKDSRPARSCVQAGAIPKGGLFEMEVIAVKAE